MATIHDRMPVILPPSARDRWLDPTTSEAELRGLLVPLAAGELNAHEVSALVNSPRNDSPECVRPVDYGKRGAAARDSTSGVKCDGRGPIPAPSPPTGVLCR